MSHEALSCDLMFLFITIKSLHTSENVISSRKVINCIEEQKQLACQAFISLKGKDKGESRVSVAQPVGCYVNSKGRAMEKRKGELVKGSTMQSSAEGSNSKQQ